jgi:hypothetical protein
MKNIVEKTLKDVFQEFLDEQKQNLKPQSYSGYERTVNYFMHYLNSYAPDHLGEEDLELYDELSEDEGLEYCEIFDLRHIGYGEIEEFLGVYVILNRQDSKNFLKIVGRVMHRLVIWLHEKGYIKDVAFEKTNERVKELKADLPIAVKVRDLMSEYAAKYPPGKYTEELDSHFTVKKIEPGNLWLEDPMRFEKLIGPVIVSEEISSMCKVGWTVVLWIGKTGDVWKVIDSKAVYPMTEY